ncbi:MAG: class I SAM-dependent methyltransferase [Actinomycetota bacterium]|nr:class I SAM-dependent methyltransferase [Actinomycetota bacterium]
MREEPVGRIPHQKFDIAKLDKLNDPARFEQIDPDLMWAALGSSAPRAIVEIGAGTGMFAGRFAEYASGALVYAADTEPVMVDWMRENRAPAYGERFIPVLSSEETIPLPDGIADLVAMINLHHELAAPAAIYAEAFRLLAPAGQVLVVDWSPGAEGRGPSQAVRVSADQIAAALKAAGFVHTATHAGLAQHSLLTGTRT